MPLASPISGAWRATASSIAENLAPDSAEDHRSGRAQRTLPLACMTDLGIELLVRVQRLFQLRHRLSDAIMWPTGGVPAWRPWRAGSRVAPRPLAVDQLEPLLAAGTCFPSIPCSATCQLRSASSRRPSVRRGRTCRSADRPQLRNAELAGRGRVWRQRRALRAGGCRWCCTAPCFSSQWSCCWVACARGALEDGWGFLDGGSAVAAHSGWR